MPSSGAFIGTTRCQARGHWLLWRLLETSLASMLVGVLRVAFAAPTGGQVASGIAVISQTGIPGQVSTTISQGSAQASLNWQSFNIAKGETVNFVQPSALPFWPTPMQAALGRGLNCGARINRPLFLAPKPARWCGV